jgi:hypothetical protein
MLAARECLFHVFTLSSIFAALVLPLQSKVEMLLSTVRCARPSHFVAVCTSINYKQTESGHPTVHRMFCSKYLSNCSIHLSTAWERSQELD